MSDSSLLTVVFLLKIIHLASAQTDICLWNVVDDGTSASYTFMNGIYEYRGTYQTKAFYVNNDTSCGGQSDGLFIYFKLQGWYIGIDPRPNPNNTVVGLVGKCDSTDVTIQNPSGCGDRWLIPYVNDQTAGDPLATAISSSTCPAWTDVCNVIDVTLSPSTTDSCDGAFTKDSSFEYDNVYSKSVDSTTTMYWYFNRKAFQWVCSTEVRFEDCKPSGTSALQQSFDSDHWQDLDLDGSITINLVSSTQATITCSEIVAPTAEPTKAPLPAGDNGPGDKATQCCTRIASLILIVFIFVLL